MRIALYELELNATMAVNPRARELADQLDAELPFGVAFIGAACSEPVLIRIGYAFEQATKRRVPPPGFR